jgi:hypothetical protein
MTISVDIQNIKRADAVTHGDGVRSFDVVHVKTTSIGSASIYLPAGTGQGVADAINAALEPKP